MPRRRFWLRDWRRTGRLGSRQRGKRSTVARRWTCWRTWCERRLIFPNDADDDALDLDIGFVDVDRGHGLVGGLEPDPAVLFAVELLHGGMRAPDQRDDGFSVARGRAAMNHDEVPVGDVLIDHRAPAHLQDIALSGR